jgi:hypothetical protein
MVTMTERAGALLEQIQQEQGLHEPPRIERDADHLALTVSAPSPDDEVLYHGETPVLRIAPEAVAFLAGCTITTQETPEGTQLAIVQGESPNGRVSADGP